MFACYFTGRAIATFAYTSYYGGMRRVIPGGSVSLEWSMGGADRSAWRPSLVVKLLGAT